MHVKQYIELQQEANEMGSSFQKLAEWLGKTGFTLILIVKTIHLG